MVYAERYPYRNANRKTHAQNNTHTERHNERKTCILTERHRMTERHTEGQKDRQND